MHRRFALFVHLLLAFSPILLLSSIAPALAAQDTRTVIEPLFPQLCTTVSAQLSTNGHSLAADDEQKLDTARIQKAIDKCGRGRAVMLHVDESNNAFLSGPLVLKPDVTLIVGLGVTLFASRDPAIFAVSPGSCGIVSHSPGPRGCKPLISVDNAPNSGVMGDGVIDGRGGEKMLGSQYSWWDLAEQARAGGGQQVPRLIVANDSDNFTLYRITLKNSPNFHVVYNHGDGFTVWGLRIDTPQRLARNTDGVDPGNGAKNITITQSFIRTGDDNVAVKGGPGGATNITVSHDHFYWGHGMSIGSETNGGVSKIRVFDLSLDGPDNGIRIKSNGSRGGLTQDVIYDDVCIRNSPNPITLDTAYSANGPLQGTSPPTMRDITLHNVRVSGGGKFTFNGYDPTHRIGATLDGVQITDQAKYTYEMNHADLTLGPDATNLQFPAASGLAKNDSTVTGTPSEGNPASCTEKFVPFPQ
ncbi:MAG TPA: glycosyl hydrolase family 28 protein [Terracidiphilus sp.]|jgi:polygalacturonase